MERQHGRQEYRVNLLWRHRIINRYFTKSSISFSISSHFYAWKVLGTDKRQSPWFVFQTATGRFTTKYSFAEVEFVTK